MADPNTRQGKRTPVTLKIKFKSETLEQFIERYAVDVSQGGIFIRTKEPLAVGTQMRFEFQLRDASPLIAGEGTVVWTRENDPSRPAIAPGMGVRFDKLADGSQTVLERILNEKAKQAPVRSPSESTKPPAFTDEPTRVAPAPVQEALLGNDSGSRASRAIKKGMADDFNESTPLPRPMPFHGDQDDFDAGAFDEATKVRSLDDLVAQTAPDSTVADMSAASVAAQDADAKSAKAPERDSAPTLPSPPESPRASQKMATVPPATTSASGLASPSSDHPGMRTQIGVEPAKSPTRSSTTTPPATKSPGTTSSPPSTATTSSPSSLGSAAQKDKDTAKAAARMSTPTEPVKRPAVKSSGGPGMAIVALLLIAVAVAAVWFFVLRKKDNSGSGGGSAGSSEVAVGTGSSQTASGSAETPSVGSGSSATMVGSGSAQPTGSGSAVATVGSNGPTNVGSGSAPPPVAALVDITIAADAQKATVEISGGPSGPAPLKAKLEKDKVYKVRVTAAGYAVLEMDVKGGEAKVTATLTMKPRTVTVTSEPAGAAIFIDNAATGKVTPAAIELTKAQAARRTTRVSLRKTGFKAVENVIDSAKWTEDAAKLTAAVDAKLVVQQIVRQPPPVNTGSGSATPPGEGSGSTPPTPTEGSGAMPSPTPMPIPPGTPTPTPTTTSPPSGGGPTEDQLN